MNLLVVALILLLLFAVLGSAVSHILWWGIVIAVGIAIYHFVAGSSRSDL